MLDIEHGILAPGLCNPLRNASLLLALGLLEGLSLLVVSEQKCLGLNPNCLGLNPNSTTF